MLMKHLLAKKEIGLSNAQLATEFCDLGLAPANALSLSHVVRDDRERLAHDF
jgi:hypothetical protein